MSARATIDLDLLALIKISKALAERFDVTHLVSLKDTAQQLQLEVSTLRGWRLRRIHLGFVKVGGRVCVTQESIDDFVKANTCPPLLTAGASDLPTLQTKREGNKS